MLAACGAHAIHTPDRIIQGWRGIYTIGNTEA